MTEIIRAVVMVLTCRRRCCAVSWLRSALLRLSLAFRARLKCVFLVSVCMREYASCECLIAALPSRIQARREETGADMSRSE